MDNKQEYDYDIEYEIGFWGVFILSTIGCIVYYVINKESPIETLGCIYCLLAVSRFSKEFDKLNKE